MELEIERGLDFRVLYRSYKGRLVGATVVDICLCAYICASVCIVDCCGCGGSG